MADGFVRFGSEDGYLYCVDARSGALKWRYQAGTELSTQAAIGEGLAFATDPSGSLLAIRLAGTK